jgi:AP-3 complex subunit delta-1
MFERTLKDLVKGIRAHKRDAGTFISGEIGNIKTELRTQDPFVKVIDAKVCRSIGSMRGTFLFCLSCFLKAQAVRKLTYLHMMGYDISWAAFSLVEVMSAPRFGHKRMGYLAASQSFTDVCPYLYSNVLPRVS